jgi:hypothetical protein
MKTETDKAIEFLEECQDEITELQEKGYDERLIKIIELLQQGEKYKKEYVEREAELFLIIKKTRKYKKMWRELRNEDVKNIWQMEAIEQKYFPKI